MAVSITASRIPLASVKTLKLMHVPGVPGNQNFSAGIHVKALVRKTAAPQRMAAMPAYRDSERNAFVENTRRYRQRIKVFVVVLISG